MRAASDDKTLKDQVTVSFLAFKKFARTNFARKIPNLLSDGSLSLLLPPFTAAFVGVL